MTKDGRLEANVISFSAAVSACESLDSNFPEMLSMSAALEGGLQGLSQRGLGLKNSFLA